MSKNCRSRKELPDLSRYLPVGMDLRRELMQFGMWMACSAFWALLAFVIQFAPSLSDLFRYVDGRKMVLPGAVMPDFYLMMDWVLQMYLVTGLTLILWIPRYYRFHSRDSMSIYLMRRLPDPWELHIRCLVFPAGLMVLCAAAAFLTVVLLFAWYMLAVPGECLTPDQWQKYWRFL